MSSLWGGGGAHPQTEPGTGFGTEAVTGLRAPPPVNRHMSKHYLPHPSNTDDNKWLKKDHYTRRVK